VYVDDMLIFSRLIAMIDKFKGKISNKFKSKDLGQLRFILGIKVEYGSENTIFLSQKHYIEKIIKQFNFENSKDSNIPIQPNHNLTSKLENKKDNLREQVDQNKYRKLIGSLIYLMTSTRPDICYAVGILSRFMSNPLELHWRYLKRVLRYIKFTIDYGLIYKSTKEANLIGYTDSDYANNLEDRKSTSGYMFKYGNCLISWNSAKQKIISLSSTES
jgi:hypothetical protein